MVVASPLNIGKSTNPLRSVSGAISGANRTIKNIGGILFRRTKFKRESIATSKTLTNKRIENENRADRESELEAPNLTKTPSGALNLANNSGGSFLDRIVGFLGYTTAGWILNNLPTWIGLGKEFIARIQKAGQIISSVANDAINIVGGFGNVLGAVGKNILSFDILDSSKRLQNAVGDLNASFEDMGKQFNDGFKLVSTPLTTKSGEGSYSGANVPSTGTPSPDQGAYPETPTPGNLGPATNLVSGARAIMNAGFPAKGAAYLAGNIQQESGWRGQRDPWVLDDGAGTNKGLVSWNRGRITNAEKFLGKPLNKASNSDQIRWIKQEMQKSYPGAYKIFMNPNASDADLQRASYIYLGYGDIGSRFAYANKAYAALQKGGSASQPAPAQVSQAPSQASLPKLPPTDTLSGGVQRYGASRDNGKRKHAGVDFDISGPSAKFYSRIGGVVTGRPFRYGADGWGIDIYNKQLGVYERIAEAAKVLVKPGESVQPGQAVVQGESGTGVIHYEIRKGIQGGFENTLNPMKFLSGAGSQVAVSSPPPSSNTPQQLTPERTGQDIFVFDTGAGQSPPSTAPSGGGGGGAPAAPDNFTMVNNFIKKQLLLDLVYL
jgi:hypothetical protein